MIVIGAPGSGKSTTVANSLSYHGYMRVRVTEQTGAMAPAAKRRRVMCQLQQIWLYDARSAGSQVGLMLRTGSRYLVLPVSGTSFYFEGNVSIAEREREREREREKVDEVFSNTYPSP